MICARLIRLTLTILLLMVLSFPLSATHQRAAEITYRHLSELTYEITLITYTYTPSPANAYRNYLTVFWGDGTASEIPRVELINLPDDISYNRYVGEHTFPGPSTYTISCEDPNRNGGILNIPNSINVPLFIYSELVINPFLEGYNNSPVLLLPPIDNACVNQPFLHNPGAWDKDGDSLSYRLVTCRGAQGLPIPGYTLPPATDSISLNPITGDLLWQNPPQQGEYNVAILIEEWREGTLIGSVLRDMQIIVIACNNSPPVIQPLQDTCVEAGDKLLFPVSAFDPDSNVITLTATGGPFLVAESKAYLDPDPAIDTGHVTTIFTWQTVCDHIQKQSYPLFFKAKDNSKPVSLSDIKSMHIKVVGPAPDDLTATPLGTTITLTWSPTSCPNNTGYMIYRSTDSTGWTHGYCETGVPAYTRYRKIATIADPSVLLYLDDNNGEGLVQGVKYCYIVTASFPDGSEGYASLEACAILKKDIPVITHASVQSTDPVTGTLYIAWSKPTEIDSLQAPGPYRYILNRSRSDFPQDLTPIATMSDLNDTIYLDTLLNTSAFFYRYAVDFYNEDPPFLIGTSQPAESMYLNFLPTDRKLKLFWHVKVPWYNQLYTIYRYESFSGNYDSIGYSFEPEYIDTGLRNGEEYCYYIRSTGKYSATGFIYPIINFSQINCGIPIDNVPPCPPILHVNTLCDESINVLSWTNPNDTCTPDILRYFIWYAPAVDQDLQVIDSVLSPYDTIYEHSPNQSIVGCYAITAMDSTGNQSALSNLVCVDYLACPVYKLPLAFTPNGDGHNDYFRPFPYTSVESISLNIFDRWGSKVFETGDPDINWDGKNQTTNQPCSEGAYFYVCDVFEITLQGIIKRTLRGSVTLLR